MVGHKCVPFGHCPVEVGSTKLIVPSTQHPSSIHPTIIGSSQLSGIHGPVGNTFLSLITLNKPLHESP